MASGNALRLDGDVPVLRDVDPHHAVPLEGPNSEVSHLLTFAALAASVLMPPGYGVPLPQPEEQTLTSVVDARVGAMGGWVKGANLDQQEGEMQAIRKHLTYANVMATMAVFLALGGSAWALSKHSVGARQLKKNAVTSAKLKKGAVTKAKIAKGAVNGVKIADGSIGIGNVSASLHLLCRSGTSYLQGACIQDSPGSDTFANAMSSCRAAGGRLPSPSELLTLVARGVTIVHPTTTFEFTDSVSFDGTNQRDEEVDMGGSGAVSNALIGGSPHPYRCVFDPTG